MKSRFSVIIPTLNEEKFLPKLLTSLTQQTVKNFEIIVVDGSSTDKTLSIVKQFAKKLPALRIQVSREASLPLQRNIGAKVALSKWFIFVDADSVLLPNFIERIDGFITKKHPKFFTTWFKTDVDDSLGAIAGFLGNMSIEGSILIDRPWSPGPLTIVRKDIFDMVGGYNEKATYAEDHDFSMNMHKHNIRFLVFREILYIYSLRRFRNEGILKAMARNSWSTFNVIFTKKVPKYAPGFVMGGGMYTDKVCDDKVRLFPKEFEEGMKRFIQKFIAL